MTLRSSVFIATSLDGYIARPDGSIDWLEAANKLVPPGEDCGFHAFMDSVDALVMGRNTFEKVLTFDAWPYGDKRVIVLASRPLAIPDRLPPSVSASSETPGALAARLAGEGVKRIYVDGGVTIQRFLAAGLIDDMTITVVPILLGAGRPLFGPCGKDIALEHLATKAYDFGFVQSSWRVAHNK